MKELNLDNSTNYTYHVFLKFPQLHTRWLRENYKTRETQCLYLKDNETNLRYSEIIDDDDGKNAQTELLF